MQEPATDKDKYLLNMAPDSVDDMYDGCMSEMGKAVEDTYLKKEMKDNTNFGKAWKKAKQRRSGGKNKIHSKPVPPEQLAIYVYTSNDPNVYADFNEAVRTQKSKYSTTFSYHSLHFYLTKAIQDRNSNRPDKIDQAKCYTGYRRTKSYFIQDVLNREIRFGTFTSSSQGDYLDPKKFGDKSCFKIWTCFGADISVHSASESEREVLIPPYEVFKVTKIEKRSDNPNLPCEVVYEVNSTKRNESNLTCALFPNKV